MLPIMRQPAKKEDLANSLFLKLKENNIPIIENDKIVKETSIGEGSYGKVYKGKFNDKDVAIKRLKFFDDSVIEEYINEIKVMLKINHPNVPKFYGVWKDKYYFCLIFDFVKGVTLKKWILKANPTYKEKVSIIIQLVDIIETTHAQNIIHRDLKPENIMIDGDNVYVIDFGVSKIYSHTQTGTENQRGTAAYFPPENCEVSTELGAKHIITISNKFDIWSIGCVATYLLTKQPPWAMRTKTSKENLLKSKSLEVESDNSNGNVIENGNGSIIDSKISENGNIDNLFSQNGGVSVNGGNNSDLIVNGRENGGQNFSSITKVSSSQAVIPNAKVEYKLFTEFQIITFLTKKHKFPVPKEIPNELREILKKCFEYDVSLRVCATDLKEELIQYFKTLS